MALIDAKVMSKYLEFQVLMHYPRCFLHFRFLLGILLSKIVRRQLLWPWDLSQMKTKRVIPNNTSEFGLNENALEAPKALSKGTQWVVLFLSQSAREH